jgi:GMP synthase (glutamine-hydrolysing)
VREQKVYCEIVPFNISRSELERHEPGGVILSGGPSSVYATGADLPGRSRSAPRLGICYGLQLMAHLLGGRVDRAARREFGHAHFSIDDDADLFRGLAPAMNVWMSHGDRLEAMPDGFIRLGHTENAGIAAMADRKRKFFGVQFHPEVAHTPKGGEVLRNFLFTICGCSGSWTPEHFVESAVSAIRSRVMRLGLSGGVTGGHGASSTGRGPAHALRGQRPAEENEAKEVEAAFRT